MASLPPKKPVNDLIKFWAEKQERDPEPISKSPRSSLFPNISSSPPQRNPQNQGFIPKSKDTSSSPSLSPTHNIHSLISEENDQGNSLSKNDDSSNKDTSSPLSIMALKSIPPVPAKNSYITRPRDHVLNTKDAFNQIGPLPPARKVTNLVNIYEKASSPNNSAPTSPTLAPIKRSQTFLTSSSLINLHNAIPEPLSPSTPTSPTLNSKSKRKQRIPEPLNISSKKFTNEPTFMSSPISPIQLTNQESSSSQFLKDINSKSTQKKVFESKKKSNIEQSDPEPEHTSTSVQASSSFNQNKNNNASKSKQLDTPLQNKTFTNREITNGTTPKTTSNSFNPFGFLKSPSESLKNLNLNPFYSSLDGKFNSNDGGNGNENYNPFLDMMSTDQSDMYKVVVGPKSEDKKRQSIPSARDTNTFIMEMHESNSMQQSRSVPKENENYSTINPMFTKPISGTIQIIEKLGNYFQPNKCNNSDGTNDSKRNTTSRDVHNDEYTMTISLGKTGSFQTFNSKGGIKSWKRQNLKPVQIPKSPYSTTRLERDELSPVSTLKNNPFIKKKTLRNTKHDLPEYNTSKTNMSMLVPHSLSSVEYGRINHSLPDLSIRYRHHQFNDAFRKNNMTVPDFTRVDSISKDEPQQQVVAMADVDVDPAMITKFSINPFNESETNELFKPGAPWIHLPHLDEFILSLPPTEFSEPKELMTAEEYENFIGYGKSDEKNIEDMFPPMNQILDGICLDDLKLNIVKNDGLLSQRVLETAIDVVLSGQTTAFGMNWMKLEIFRDFVQFLALILSFVPAKIFGYWVKIILNVIPNLLSFNLDRVFGNGTTFFLVFCVMVLGGLYWFRIMTKYDPNADVEGLESHPWNLRPESKRRHNVVIVFTLTTLYLPLSKLSIDALVWSESFWPITNPYDNGVDFPDFGSGSDKFRDPKDFCYVTSMNKDDLNFSPVIIVVAIIIICVFSFWFPIALKRLVDKNLPRVDKYDELGETRHNTEAEYRKLLMKDTCPYNFLYSGEILLLFEPFLDKGQNLSEYWSRAGYVITSVLVLLTVLKIGPGKQISYAMIATDFIVGAFVVWYIIVQTNRYKSFVKVMRKRLDFSLNIYSPKLDFAKHIKRRVWQETWSTLLLTSEQFKMRDGKTVAFSQSPFRPPYLLNFSGTVAERHVENLKIIRQIGINNYISAMAPLPESLAKLRLSIVNNFVGPDMYYAPEFLVPKIKTCFGKAYAVPFPFSVVIVYDDDESVLVLTKEWEIQRFVQQNESKEIRRRRLVRHMLRALEGQMVLGPCNQSDINQPNIDKKMGDSIHYHHGILSIQRNKVSKWCDHNMNPGFNITISFSSHECVMGHDVLGITDDFQMTFQLQKFFSDNQKVVQEGLVQIQRIMDQYRQYYRDEAQWKEEVLSYGFFVNIYDNPSIPLESLPALLMTTEENKLIQAIPESEYPSIIYLYERMRIINLSRVHQWWYLFWEDLWRKNHKEMPDLVKYPQYFSPAYRTSLCYRPMTRSELEEFLEQRGCWQNGGKNGFLHSGVLNRIYLYLNNVVFGRKTKNGTSRRWNITKGNTIEKGAGNNLMFDRAKRTLREKITIMADVMLRKKNSFPRTRPFFVLQEEDSDTEQSDNSDEVNSASDDENWW
ncbi:3957_t:CDS:2 [Funneliformis caledonium]|uniref:3957_t:CDS:1 n=1 Tax=Funneliformis caledonium TaxID=1117310 RepID=A0A9N8W5Q7_9GLOM|nr:3957_t:CDS:2 [Funneliformis caledonium]